jgi:diacylglycerol kinase family enzyme
VKIVLVYNPRSGAYSSIEELRALFADSSIEIINSIKIGHGFESRLKRYIQRGAIIAVVGGDGSISAVAHLLKNTNAILMPLPGGTLNHFTKDLGIPQSLSDSLEYFKSAKKVKIDTGQVGDKTFINNSSIGIYSDSLLERDEHEKKYGKWPAMMISILMAFFRFRTYDVDVNGKNYSTPLVFIGNNRYTLKGLTFERSELHGGTLSMYIVIGESRLNLFWAMVSLILGKKNVSKKLTSFNTKGVVIVTNKSIRISRDGEHEKMTSPLKYSIEESSLYILQAHREK